MVRSRALACRRAPPIYAPSLTHRFARCSQSAEAGVSPSEGAHEKSGVEGKIG